MQLPHVFIVALLDFEAAMFVQFVGALKVGDAMLFAIAQPALEAFLDRRQIVIAAALAGGALLLIERHERGGPPSLCLFLASSTRCRNSLS